jgi:hypothetical protein
MMMMMMIMTQDDDDNKMMMIDLLLLLLLKMLERDQLPTYHLVTKSDDLCEVMWFQSIGCSTQHPTTAADSL